MKFKDIRSMLVVTPLDRTILVLMLVWGFISFAIASYPISKVIAFSVFVSLGLWYVISKILSMSKPSRKV
jgi:putative Mn2+ efflux pump MntP